MKPLSAFLLLLLFCAINCSAQFEKSKWISPGFIESPIHRPCVIFKKLFDTKQRIQSATLLITAHGLYEATINNKRVGNAYFTPGWTNYDQRLQYQQYDVTRILNKQHNEILVTIGEGWYRGPFGGNLESNNYGKDASLLFQLDIVYSNGQKETIISDGSWKAATGPILRSEIYDGELYDARISPKKWSNVTVNDFSKNILVPQECEYVEKQEIFKPLKSFTTPNGEHVIDFGQNMSGWVKCSIKGKAGDTVKIFHAETLDKQGNFFRGNLREALAADIYVLSGKKEVFEPHFTYHGFRYIKVEGRSINENEFTAIAVHTNLQHTGTFECSDSMINKLQSNIEWSLNSNFFDIPTDCPQRSERLGWTADAQVFCSTAAFNRNVQNFFIKWLRDLKSEQGSNGGLSNIIPDIYTHLNRGSKSGVSGWGDATTIVPWTIFWTYNDTAILREQYSSMKAWVDYITSVSADDYLWKANGYGDWYAPGKPTYLPYVDQCFWAYSTQLLIGAAKVLDKKEDIGKYEELLKKIKSAFISNYIGKEGITTPNTQTSYVLALQFDLLPDSLRNKAAEKLVELIHDNHNHLATGFLGTPYLLHVLSKYHHDDVAYTLLKQDTYPSWLYPVKSGATTIWEKWDGILADGNVQATSYNHYAYGAVGDWLYRVVAGIQSATPGYKKIIIQPHVGGGLTWANASYQCSYGKIISQWKLSGDKIIMHVEIPAGTSATIYVPGGEIKEVGPGNYDFDGKK